VRVELAKAFQFEAAHANPTGGPAQQRMHGHSYRVTIRVEGACDARLGWLVDYADISAAFDPLFNQLDHRCLNDVDGLADVSTEGVSGWIAERLRPAIPILKAVEAEIVGDCAYAPQANNASIAFTFEAAHYLPNLPADHKCRRLHGHSFRVNIESPTVSDLTDAARTIFDALDHRNLNELAGLENPTSEHVSRWIWEYLIANAKTPAAVTVAETCTAKCIYRG
jgi:6-pyruvoyltetrahydropterin/6-carboxytetrahydropterin synthase